MEPDEAARIWEANADAWTEQARRGLDVYREVLNTPAFLNMLPAIDGLRGLDVGCGEGSNTQKLARRGARMWAVDIAPSFIRHARAAEETEPLGIVFQAGDGMALPFDDMAFDFVTAFMSLMDMPDPGRALSEASRVLRPGGFLQFSILHPCFAPPLRQVLRDKTGVVRALVVAGYFNRVQTDTYWLSASAKTESGGGKGFRTVRFHRTLADWVAMIIAAGLTIEAMGEPSAEADLVSAVPALAELAVAPLFLHVRARKR